MTYKGLPFYRQFEPELKRIMIIINYIHIECTDLKIKAMKVKIVNKKHVDVCLNFKLIMQFYNSKISKYGIYSKFCSIPLA